MVIDCLPPVPPGDHPKAVHMSIRHEDARLIDELITLPGMAGRTRADVIRSLTFVGLKALDEVRKIDSPAWKTQLALAEAPIIRSNRKLNEEMLAAAVKNLRDDLLELCFQDRWEDAWDEWRNFYEQFVKMNWFLQQAALWSLRTMPISQLLVRKFAAHVPDDFPVPEADPPSLSLHTDIGVYKPGMALGIEMPNSNVTLNAPLQFLIGAPSGSS